MTPGRIVAVIVLAALILFPGVELLRFVFADLLGVYQEMSLTDCLLFFVIVFQCALLLQRRGEEPRLRAVGAKVEDDKQRPQEQPKRRRSSSPRRSRTGQSRTPRS